MMYDYKGSNYATELNVENNNLQAFNNDNKLFTLGLDELNNLYSNENELVMEFNNDNDDMELCEVRLHCPPIYKLIPKENEENKEENKEEENNDNNENDNSDNEIKDEYEKISQSLILEKMIKTKGNLKIEETESICFLKDLQFLKPRGKYTCDFCTKFIKFQGNTYNFVVQYKNISKVFLVPRENNMLFVISLDKPLKLGNTSYPHLLIQFKADKEEEINLRLPQNRLNEINSNLKNYYNESYYQIFSKLISFIIGINITIPSDFKNFKGGKSINANYDGDLFFFGKSLLFIKNVIIYIKLSNIVKVEYARVGSKVSRDFDMIIINSSGSSHNFNNIQRDNLNLIKEYFEKNNTTQKDVQDEEIYDQDEYMSEISSKNSNKNIEDEEDEEDDEDYDENEFIDNNDNNSESESNDEDFKPEK